MQCSCSPELTHPSAVLEPRLLGKPRHRPWLQQQRRRPRGHSPSAAQMRPTHSQPSRMRPLAALWVQTGPQARLCLIMHPWPSSCMSVCMQPFLCRLYAAARVRRLTCLAALPAEAASRSRASMPHARTLPSVRMHAGPFGDINASFTLTSAYLVFFMHCGFAMVQAPFALAPLQHVHARVRAAHKQPASNPLGFHAACAASPWPLILLSACTICSA